MTPQETQEIALAVVAEMNRLPETILDCLVYYVPNGAVRQSYPVIPGNPSCPLYLEWLWNSDGKYVILTIRDYNGKILWELQLKSPDWVMNSRKAGDSHEE